MRLSFDYLVNALRQLDDKTYRFKEEIPDGRLALGEKQPLIQSGLADYYEKRTDFDNGMGRCRKAYRLILPYENITVGHLITSSYPHSSFERHLFDRLRYVKLSQLDDVILPDKLSGTPRYSAEKLIDCLACLSTDYAIPLHPTLYRVTAVARKVMQDMVTIGVVEANAVNLRGKTKAYKLVRPLSEVSIEILLPYLFSMSASRQYYNRLFYAVKDSPVSLLVRTVSYITLTDKVITKSQ